MHFHLTLARVAEVGLGRVVAPATHVHFVVIRDLINWSAHPHHGGPTMRKSYLFLLPVCVLSLLTFVPNARTAPALTDRPVKYEYAELSFTRTPVVAGRAGGLGGGGGGGGPPPGPAGMPIRWTTGEEEIEVQEWSQLGDKLKAPAPKKDSPQSVHKFRVLNKLSADGWEMIDQSLGDIRHPSIMGLSFRRRLP
jgi:hypothetical protein